MSLATYFQISVSVFCTIASLFLLMLLIGLVMIRFQLAKLIKNMEDITDSLKATTIQAQEFTRKTLSSLETLKNGLFTFEFIRRLVVEIMNLIKSNQKRTKDGQAK